MLTTVEHYYQAQKFEDDAYRERIFQAITPREAKTLGRTSDRPARKDWDSVRQEVMLRAVAAKFCGPTAGSAELGRRLLDTGEKALIEASPCDDYWGGGADGKGANHLGQILMAVRAALRLEGQRQAEHDGGVEEGACLARVMDEAGRTLKGRAGAAAEQWVFIHQARSAGRQFARHSSPVASKEKAPRHFCAECFDIW